MFEKTRQALAGRWPTDPVEEGLAKIAVGRMLNEQIRSGRPGTRYEMECGDDEPSHGGIIILPLVGFFVAVSMFLFASHARPPSIRHPADVTGVVIGNVDRSDAEDDAFYPIIQYEALNVSWEIEATRSRNSPASIGAEYTVRYEEEDPETAYILGDRGNGRALLIAAGGMVPFLLSLYGAWEIWRRFRFSSGMISEGKQLTAQTGADPRVSTVTSFSPQDHLPLLALIGPTITGKDPRNFPHRFAAALIPPSGPIPIDVFIPTGSSLNGFDASSQTFGTGTQTFEPSVYTPTDGFTSPPPLPQSETGSFNSWGQPNAGSDGMTPEQSGWGSTSQSEGEFSNNGFNNGSKGAFGGGAVDNDRWKDN